MLVLCACLLASVSAQNDLMRTMLMLRMFGGDSSSGSSSGSSPAGTPGSAAGATRGGGLSSLFGGGMMNPMLLMGMGGDRMRDMMMCNALSGMMRTLCMTRAFQ